MDSNERIIELLENSLKAVMIFIDKNQTRMLQVTEELNNLKQSKGVTVSNTVEIIQAPQQWEYKKAPEHLRVDEFNKLGEEGWEAFSVGEHSYTRTMLKRPKPPKKTPNQGYSGYGR